MAKLSKEKLHINKTSHIFTVFKKISFTVHKREGFHIKLIKVKVSNTTDSFLTMFNNTL